MTQRQRAGAATRVRGATRSGVRPVLVRRRRPGHLGPVHIAQLLLVEVALVAVVAAAGAGAVPFVVTVIVTTALLLAVTWRSNGRWWLERTLMVHRLRRRQRVGPDPDRGDPRLAALSALVPGLTLIDVPTADGRKVGVARDDAGWYAAAVRDVGTAMRQDPSPPVPLDVLAGALVETGQPGTTLQVVRLMLTAPSLDTHPSSLAGESYRQLVSGCDGAGTVAEDLTWVAVRLNARELAENALHPDLDLTRAPAVVAALVRNAAKSLRRVGVSTRPLDRAGLLTALARSLGLDVQLEPGAEPAHHVEEWTSWHSSGLAHRCFWIRRWPPLEQCGELLDRLAAVPATMTHTALTVTPTGSDEFDLRGLVRVSAPVWHLDWTSEEVLRQAAELDAELVPLDGEHGPAAYASAPTGGGAG